MTLRTPLLLLSLLLSLPLLADSADLKIVAAQQGSPLSVLVPLVNHGPDIARNGVVTVDVPAGLTVTPHSIYGTCTTEGSTVRCPLGDVPVYDRDKIPPGVLYLSFDFQAPLVDATYVVTFRTSSDTPDPVSENNVATITFVTKVEADMHVLVEAKNDRTDPGGTVGFRAGICNNIRDNLAPTDIRIDFTATNGTIESITGPEGVACTIDGATATCRASGMPGQCFAKAFDVTTRASNDRRGGETKLAVHVTSNVPESNTANDRQEKSVAVYRWIAVENTNDGGAGSLRDAIEQANAGCSPGPCRIVFEIPGPVPAEGWFTITPTEPLPDVTADRVTIEGTRQTAFTGDTNANGPEIAIDGRLAHRGLKMLAPCEGVVEGLALGHFDADQGLWISSSGAPYERCGNRPDRRSVAMNHIGVDPSGTVAWPNLRGLRADDANVSVSKNVISHNTYSGIWMWRGWYFALTENRLEHNGASAVFLGPKVQGAGINHNTIRNNREMGVAVARGATRVDVRHNSMKDNGGLAIDWGLDGVSPVNADDSNGAPSNAPVILSATYDPATNVTTIVLNVQSTPLGGYFSGGTIEIFANDHPNADGERYLGAIIHPDTTQTQIVQLHGDYRGQWLNATWTRVHYAQIVRTPDTDSTDIFPPGNSITSEFSNAVPVN